MRLDNMAYASQADARDMAGRAILVEGPERRLSAALHEARELVEYLGSLGERLHSQMDRICGGEPKVAGSLNGHASPPSISEMDDLSAALRAAHGCAEAIGQACARLERL